jgi:tape measure domain-containing protein
VSTLSTNNIVVNYQVNAADLEKVLGTFGNLTQEERRMLGELKKVNTELTKTGKDGADGIKQVSKEVNNLTSLAKGGAGILAGFFAIGQIQAFAKEIIDVTAKYQQFQKAIDFATGSSENGAKAFKFLQETAQKYGLDLRALTEGYKGFSASSNLAGTSLNETNRQFLAVSKAASALGLDSQRTGLVLNGLSQIASKGVVSMEELRQQIGDSLPGALGIAARSMNMTTQAFIKFVSDGKLASADFLPRFATELEKTFGPSAEKNLNNLTATQNRFNSSIDNLILAVGNKLEPYLKGAYELAGGIANQLGRIGGQAKKDSTESVAAKRAESDLAKKILDISIQYGVQISKQRAATQVIFDLEKKIGENTDKQIQTRLKYAGDVTGRGKVRIKQLETESEILQKELEVITKIAGVEVTNEKVVQKTQEELKKEYDLRLKILETERQIRQLQGEIANNPNAGLAAERSFYEGKAKLQREYAGKGLEINQREIKATKLQEQKAGKELKQRYEVQLMDRYKVSKKADEDVFKGRVETLKNESKAREDWMKDNDKKSDAFNDKQYKKYVEAENQKREALQMTYDLAANSVQSLFQLQSAYLDVELAQLNKRYNAEVRLAEGNEQKLTELEEKRAAKEREIRIKQFRIQQQAAVAQVIFNVAPIIAQQIAGVVTAPLAAASYATAAAQIAFILAQPVPEFAEGTKGKAHKGKAIVGELGQELVVTESGKTYLTPGTASLVDFKEKSHVIPANITEKFLGSYYSNMSLPSNDGKIVQRLESIESTLKNIPVTQLSMDERGFEKFIRTPKRTTKILNNRIGK